jgi:hypothetical protein
MPTTPITGPLSVTAVRSLAADNTLSDGVQYAPAAANVSILSLRNAMTTTGTTTVSGGGTSAADRRTTHFYGGVQNLPGTTNISWGGFRNTTLVQYNITSDPEIASYYGNSNNAAVYVEFTLSTWKANSSSLYVFQYTLTGYGTVTTFGTWGREIAWLGLNSPGNVSPNLTVYITDVTTGSAFVNTIPVKYDSAGETQLYYANYYNS